MSLVVRPRGWGGPEVLEVEQVPEPAAGAGEVVVEVRAAGVNPIDWKLYSGSFHTPTDGLPRLGLEAAGVVVQVGRDVNDVAVGDAVLVHPVVGAYAERVVARESSIVPKPRSLSWPEAGGLLLAATTAAHALHAAGVGRGDTVLVHAGAGGVGLMAVQLAGIAGARAIATASPRNHALLRELGAVPVVYGPGLEDRVRALAPDGVDAAVDAAGTDEALDVSLSLVGDPRRIASIVGGVRRGEAGVRTLGYGPGQDPGTAFRASVRRGLVDAAADGRLRVLVAAAFPLREAAAAHRVGRAGHRPGKLVLLS